MSNDVSRRDFLRKAGVGALGLGVLTLTGCAGAAGSAPPPPGDPPPPPPPPPALEVGGA